MLGRDDGRAMARPGHCPCPPFVVKKGSRSMADCLRNSDPLSAISTAPFRLSLQVLMRILPLASSLAHHVAGWRGRVTMRFKKTWFRSPSDR